MLDLNECGRKIKVLHRKNIGKVRIRIRTNERFTYPPTKLLLRVSKSKFHYLSDYRRCCEVSSQTQTSIRPLAHLTTHSTTSHAYTYLPKRPWGFQSAYCGVLVRDFMKKHRPTQSLGLQQSNVRHLKHPTGGKLSHVKKLPPIPSCVEVATLGKLLSRKLLPQGNCHTENFI